VEAEIHWRRRISWLCLGLALVFLMPSNQSLWIDEGYTAPYAQARDFGSFISRLVNDQGSEALMPLGMFSTWAGARLFGQTERGLRLVSALCAAVSIFMAWRIGTIIGLPWLALIFACHPYVWYYGGEARPYAMLIAMGTGVLYALTALVYSDSSGTGWGLKRMLVFGPLLCATHLLGVVPFVASTLVFVVLVVTRGFRLTRREWGWIAVSAASIVGIGIYYIWALARGAETAWIGPWSYDVGSIVFSAYELLGFAGFGPGRYELRQLAIDGGIPAAAEGFLRLSSLGAAILVGIYTSILVGFLARLRSGSRPVCKAILVATFVVLLTLVTSLVGSIVTATPFWGRHLAAVFPFIQFVVALAAGRGRKPGAAVVGPCTVFLIGTLVVSSLIVRFSSAHARDDYREAAQFAVTAVRDGRSVWWAAAPEAAAYYGVPFCDTKIHSPKNCVVFAANIDLGSLEAFPEPSVIILSKPELFDTSAIVQEYVESHGFEIREEFLAFRVFQSTGEKRIASVS
jgi:hypothetical protein